ERVARLRDGAIEGRRFRKTAQGVRDHVAAHVAQAAGHGGRLRDRAAQVPELLKEPRTASSVDSTSASFCGARGRLRSGITCKGTPRAAISNNFFNIQSLLTKVLVNATVMLTVVRVTLT